MAQTNNWYSGSDLKFLIEITADGFSMANDDWAISVCIDGKILHRYEKADCVQDGNNWFVCISRDVLTKYGKLSLIAEAEVPDSDFEEDVRHEVDKVIIGTYSKV